MGMLICISEYRIPVPLALRRTDADAVRSDWDKVGNDIRVAISRFHRSDSLYQPELALEVDEPRKEENPATRFR